MCILSADIFVIICDVSRLTPQSFLSRQAAVSTATTSSLQECTLSIKLLLVDEMSLLKLSSSLARSPSVTGTRRVLFSQALGRSFPLTPHFWPAGRHHAPSSVLAREAQDVPGERTCERLPACSRTPLRCCTLDLPPSQPRSARLRRVGFHNARLCSPFNVVTDAHVRSRSRAHKLYDRTVRFCSLGHKSERLFSARARVPIPLLP
eukprot:6207162-Pleurochrysis_carterae.AAC.7